MSMKMISFLVMILGKGLLNAWPKKLVHFYLRNLNSIHTSNLHFNFKLIFSFKCESSRSITIRYPN